MPAVTGNAATVTNTFTAGKHTVYGEVIWPEKDLDSSTLFIIAHPLQVWIPVSLKGTHKWPIVQPTFSPH